MCFCLKNSKKHFVTANPDPLTTKTKAKSIYFFCNRLFNNFVKLKMTPLFRDGIFNFPWKFKSCKFMTFLQCNKCRKTLEKILMQICQNQLLKCDNLLASPRQNEASLIHASFVCRSQCYFQYIFN